MGTVRTRDLRTMVLGVELTVLGFGLWTVWSPGWAATLVAESLVVVGALVVAAGWAGERYRRRIEG